MIKLQDIVVAYDDSKIVLDHVDLDIYDGETLVILGASGSGKSTALRLIIGLQKPTSGRIFIDGEDITDYDEERMDRVRRYMGMVFQYSALFDSMTVGENVAFGLRQHRELSEEEIREIVAAKLHDVGLDGTQDMMPNELSGGMKKRVSLARAIALDPKIILYDEPTAGLDPVRSTDISRLIVATQKKLHPISIVVTHDMASACRIANRIAMIYEGELIAFAPVDAFQKLQDPRIQDFFHTLKLARSVS